jgi:hypothetical protein
MGNRLVQALLSSSAIFCTLAYAGLAQAAPSAFTDRGAYDAAVAGLSNVSIITLNFDGLTAGDLIADGDTVDGISFSYDLGGVSLQVTDGADTTSALNFLGTNDFGMLQDGDDFQLGFGARNAVGLYVMSLDGLIDDDFQLTVGSFSASLSTADLQYTLNDDTSVYFLGIVDPTATFTVASVTTSHDGQTGYFLWNADDVVTAVAQVPEPGTWAMLIAGLGLLGIRTRGGAVRRGSDGLA